MVELQAGQDDNGRRLDRILRKALPDHSLSLIHRLLRQGKVLVNGKPAGPETRVQAGSVIKIELLLTNTKQEVNKSGASPAPLPEVLWQGCGIIVFNKPAGLATHGLTSINTMVNENFAGTLPHSLSFKPGPLHRLDKPTSGAIAFSQTLEGAQFFSRLLRERRVVKTYLAIVEGVIPAGETWQDTLLRDRARKKTFTAGGAGAQCALTKIRPVFANDRYTLIEARIATGRTHQIRAQAAARRHPLAGDRKYGGRGILGERGFFLHAWKIEFNGNLVVAPLPESFLSRITAFFGREFAQ
ncbi:MAG: RluA family pseudouridine synthase [Treponema sp.]|jgi:23S rRNA pseudouridine955/2504/2580 synthase|nr:RluA family pseudouridine synthase [Treponema sp.]